jgi:hypothetical protein
MPVHFDTRDHVARVTIDRPEVLNAVDATTERELERIWSAIEADRSVRAVVLTGGGERAFCTGADMKGGSGKSGLEYWAEARPNGFGGIALRQTLDAPVIARVNGHAAGGGFEMVLGCDIVVAVEEASFALPEARVGRLPLDGGMTLLQRQVPLLPTRATSPPNLHRQHRLPPSRTRRRQSLSRRHPRQSPRSLRLQLPLSLRPRRNPLRLQSPLPHQLPPPRSSTRRH